MKLNIQIIGANCSKCEKLFQRFQKIISEFQIDATVTKSEDIKILIAQHVFTIPSVLIDDIVVSKGTLLSEKQIIRILNDHLPQDKQIVLAVKTKRIKDKKQIQLFVIIVIIISAILCITLLSVNAQNTDSISFKLPVVALKTLEGKNVSSSEITNSGKPVVLIFWKSCCSPNIKMLDEINEVYPDWKKETGVALITVSIDDSRSSAKIAPLINGKGWEFTVFLDPNSDFKRAMNVITTPHVFIINGHNEVIWQKTAYNPGDANEIYKILKAIK
ncbi:MAG: thioredoxin family protein [Bacteroidia bacterium]|nr:thioredoxin family protein [Bacteroidia bacterium]